jgi:hypothetical protein
MDRQRSGNFSEGAIALARNLLISSTPLEFLQKLELGASGLGSQKRQ